MDSVIFHGVFWEVVLLKLVLLEYWRKASDVYQFLWTRQDSNSKLHLPWGEQLLKSLTILCRFPVEAFHWVPWNIAPYIHSSGVSKGLGRFYMHLSDLPPLGSLHSWIGPPIPKFLWQPHILSSRFSGQKKKKKDDSFLHCQYRDWEVSSGKKKKKKKLYVSFSIQSGVINCIIIWTRKIKFIVLLTMHHDFTKNE